MSNMSYLQNGYLLCKMYGYEIMSVFPINTCPLCGYNRKEMQTSLKLYELVEERIDKEDKLWEQYKNTDNLNYRFILQSLLEDANK